MSIFPFLDTPAVNKNNTSNNELPLFKEYAWDFEENKFIRENGKIVVLEGIEALKVWVYKALKTQRYRYLAYSWNYGHELEDLIGNGYSKSFTKSEAKRYLEECLLINKYIKGITNVETSFNKDELSIDFTLITVYGSVNMSI